MPIAPLLISMLALAMVACAPATEPATAPTPAPATTSAEPSPAPASPAPASPAPRADTPAVSRVQASSFLVATATVDGELAFREAASDSGVWMIEDDRFVVMLSLSPDTLGQISRAEWEAFEEDRGTTDAAVWLLEVMDLVWPKQLDVTVENKTSRPMSVAWEQSALIEADGRSSRVIKSGVRFSEMGSPVPPTSIPPGAKLEDILAPVDGVSYSETRQEWQQSPILYAADVGRAFSVFLALEVDGEASYLSVDFDIAERIQAVVD